MLRIKVVSIAVLIASTFCIASCNSGPKNQEQFWTQFIEACSPSSQLNGKAYFLGSTNQIGPGSVWGLAGGTTNFVAPASAYLGPPSATGKYAAINYAATPSPCTSKGSRTWSLALGLPVSFGNGNSESANLTASLSHAKTITVSITGVAVDSVPVALWEDAANKIDHSSAEFTDAADGKHYVLAAAEAVTGLTVKYTVDSSVGADLKANFQAGNTVNVGTSQNPAEIKLDVSGSGDVVTLTVPDNARSYVLGQFLQLQPIAVARTSPAPPNHNGGNPGVAVVSDQPRIKVVSMPPQ